MDNFESRAAKVSFRDEAIYRFVTDIRNFERFIPSESVKNWQATNDSCSFEIPYAGKTILKITQKKPCSEVNYTGNGFRNTEFLLKILIIKESENSTVVKVIVQTSLNPMLKLIAAKPLEQFIGRMITELENFDGWESPIS
jgi:carbon monoxide dehydrogenase subunit G